MTDTPFNQPISVSMQKEGATLAVSSVEEAAKVLMSVDWPGERDEWHRDAVDACLKVIEGNRALEDAEKAFREAAGRAAVLLPD